MLSVLLVLAALLPLAGTPQATPPPVGDNIAALGATMAKGQVVVLTNPLGGTDVLPRTQQNFDGSPNGTSVAGACGGATNGPNNQQMAYSRGTFDPTRPTMVPYLARGGGHTDSCDGTLYGVNVNAAAASVLATGKPVAHTILAPSPRYIPSTVTNGAAPGVGVTNPTVTVVAFANGVITVSAANVGNFPGPQTWIAGVGVPDYTYIASGSGTTQWTPSNPVNVTVGETLQYSYAQWAALNKNGQYVPPATHTYKCTAILINSNTVVLGSGPYPWGDLGSDQPGGPAGTFDLGTGIAARSSGSSLGNCQWDGSQVTNLSPDYTDGFWYTFHLPFGGAIQRCTNTVPFTCTNILDLTSADGGQVQIVAAPSPTSGAGKQAYFNDGTASGWGQFVYVDDISHIVAGQNTACGPRQASGNPYPLCYGTYTSNLFLNPNDSNSTVRAFTSDGKYVIAWDTAGGPASQLVDIAITKGSSITGAMAVEVPTTGNLPQVLAGQCINIWFLPKESIGMRLFLLDNCGQLSLARL